MKTICTIFGLLLATMSFGQPKNLEASFNTEDAKITDLSVSVTVESAEELESTFKMKDIKKILNEVDDNEDVTFQITCNGNQIVDGVDSSISYSITGNTSDMKAFIKRIKKIKKAAKQYYNNK